MAKLFLHIMTSLDGYIEDAAREMDWSFADDEWDDYVNGVLRSIDGVIFGRRAHQLLAQYWPTAHEDPTASKGLLESARWMRELPKYVLTSGGYTTGWENSRVLDGDVAARIRELKNQAGRDLALFAGANAFQRLDDLGLVDEYRIVVSPAVLGAGTPLWQPGGRRAALRLTGLRQFRSGAVLHAYAPATS